MHALLGLHHVTAIASDPQRNIDFYTELLGLRMVKKTVNFDDPQTYHFYYGDDAGTPGTILTFFPWVGAHRGRPGAGETLATAFRVPAGSLDYWADRLGAAGVLAERTEDRFGAHVLRLRDPDGMALELVEDAQVEAELRSSRWSDVAPHAALNGFHSVTLAVRSATATAEVLVAMGYRQQCTEANRIRFVLDAESRAGIVDLLVDADLGYGRPGAGCVHHIAFRVQDDEDQLAWREHLIAAGQHPTPVRDRNYFHSIYFREPGGVLFELATDPPGFAVDEPLESLGEALKLPVWIEEHRELLEKSLPSVQLPGVGQGIAHG